MFLKVEVSEDFMEKTLNQSDNYRWRYRLASRGCFLKTSFFLQTLKNSN